jgi:K+-transporting ATPase ATPase C chain
MKKNLLIAIAFTLVTTIFFGLVYPLAVTALAQVFFPSQANGQLIVRDGNIVGSRIIGQAFTGAGYFHSRPSAAGAGNGYDGTASGGSNLGPTNKVLLDHVQHDVHALQAGDDSLRVPVDLVTSSGSGLDPHITPAAAEFQIARVAGERKMPVTQVQSMVARHTEARQFGFLGEPRVNVLELNLELDARHADR